MGSAERKQKIRTETRLSILDSALLIAKSAGWHALSMRKIAESIEYTTPVIYEYFANKDGLLEELTRLGFLKLSAEMKIARDRVSDPVGKLEAMWMAYGQFAFREKELYQLMFGIDTACCADRTNCPGDLAMIDLVGPVISGACADKRPGGSWIRARFYAYWASVHGLIALSIIGRFTRLLSVESLMLASIRGVSSAGTFDDPETNDAHLH